MPAEPAPSAPAGPRYGRAQRRLLTAAAGLVVVALAAGAFALTYDTLRDLAVAGRVDDRWAPIYPAMADALITMTLLSLVVTRRARWWTRLLRWVLLLLLAGGSAALAVQDAVWGLDPLPDDAVRAGVAVAPHVMLVVGVWLWLTMFKQIRVARPADEVAEIIEAQRGHVKVLPALEAPAEPEDAPSLPRPANDDDAPATTLDILPGMAPPPAPDVPAPDEFPFEEPEPVLDRALAPPREPEPEPEPAPEPASVTDDVPVATTGPVPDDDFERAPDPETVPRPVPALLPTDVEVARAAGRPARDARPLARTTRPDMVMPGLDDHDFETPGADRAEDPDAGEPASASGQDTDVLDDPDDPWEPHPPPSSNFRSGPTPPAE